MVLTGGIAAGKSAASAHFSSLGVPVIDTDVIAHELVEPGRPALERIAQELGTEFLDDYGRLNRSLMRRAIFRDEKIRTGLESILHPLIATEALRQVDSITAPYCILVIPLFSKSSRWSFVDRVLVIDTEREKQVERVMARDGIGRDQAKAILKVQISRKERLSLADDVIYNNGDLWNLRNQVEALHQRYLQLSEQST